MKHQKQHEVEITPDALPAYEEWRVGRGRLSAIPLTVAEREVLLTGACQEAWNESVAEALEDL
jgi:hypothetical protein